MKFKTLLLAAVATMSFSAMANTAATDSMYINDLTVSPGDSVLVTLNFKNATRYAATQGDITFGNEGLTPVKTWDEDREEPVWFLKANQIRNFSISGNNPKGNNMVRWVEFDLSNGRCKTGDAPYAYFSLKVAGDVAPGKYECTITATHYSTGVVSENGSEDGDGPDTKFYVNVLASGVSNVTAAKDVKGVQYYNLAGQASATPFEGVNVVVKTYADGSKSVSKQILK